MSECANLELRELLPDLLHDELSAGRRAQVEAHVAGCPSCADELSLLRTAFSTLRAAPLPRIDTAALVAALPTPARAAVPSVAIPPRSRFAWRIAAALTVVTLGGLSFAVARSGRGPRDLATSTPIPSIIDRRTPAVSPTETTVAVASPTVTGRPAPVVGGLSAAGGVSDLNELELKALLGDLERLEAAPVAEPEALSGSRLVNGGATGTEE